MGHVNKVSHVFTLSHVAEMLGEDGVMAFTDDGIENLKELIAIHKEDPSIIEKRRHVLAAMIKPKNEESDEV